MLTARALVLAAVCSAGLGVLRGAEPGPLRLTAYINIASGCQKPTEQCLKDLAAKYAGRVALEFVDFGTPAGRARWTADGRHCLAIALNGSTSANIVFKGAELRVTFEMPAGYNWLHEELETAVRQRLDGVAPADRIGPAISVQTTAEPAKVLAGGQVILEVAGSAPAEQFAAVLREAATTKALVQDDFDLDIVAGSAKVTLRGVPLLDLGRVDAPATADAGAQAMQTFLRLIRPFPRVSRPFLGQTSPQMRR